MSFSSSPLLSSLYRWHCVTSTACHRLTFNACKSQYSLECFSEGEKSPYLTIFPSTEDATNDPSLSYKEGVGLGYRDLVINLQANGKNIEFYSSDTYISTQRGTLSPSGTSAPGLYDFTLKVAKPVWPIMAKILSTPKRRDAGGHLVKDDAVIYGLTLSVSDDGGETSPVARPSVDTTNPFSDALSSAAPSPLFPPAAAQAARVIENLQGRVALLEMELATLKASLVPEMTLIYVYGTLKRGFFNYERYLHPSSASYSGTSEFVSEAETVSPYSLVVAEHGVPFLIEGERDPMKVKGELFRVDKEKLVHLDYLEGAYVSGDWYDPKTIDVISSVDGKIHKAVTYISVGERGRKGLDNGTYEEYTKEMHNELYCPKEER